MLPLLLLLAAGGGAVAAGGAAATRALGARRPGRAATSAAAEAVRPGGGLARSGSAARLAGAWVLPVAVLAALAALRPAAAVVLQAEVEVLADGLGFAEGPVWLPAPRSALLFSDIAADQLLTWTRRAGVQVRRRGEPGGRIILTEPISPPKIPAGLCAGGPDLRRRRGPERQPARRRRPAGDISARAGRPRRRPATAPGRRPDGRGPRRR